MTRGIFTPDRFNAISSLVPGAKFSYHAGVFTWEDEREQPTEQQINTELQRLVAEFNATKYQENRAAEYPSVGDQLDALFKAGVFPSDMADKIQAIKDKYPKV